MVVESDLEEAAAVEVLMDSSKRYTVYANGIPFYAPQTLLFHPMYKSSKWEDRAVGPFVPMKKAAMTGTKCRGLSPPVIVKIRISR